MKPLILHNLVWTSFEGNLERVVESDTSPGLSLSVNVVMN